MDGVNESKQTVWPALPGVEVVDDEPLVLLVVVDAPLGSPAADGVSSGAGDDRAGVCLESEAAAWVADGLGSNLAAEAEGSANGLLLGVSEEQGGAATWVVDGLAKVCWPGVVLTEQHGMSLRTGCDGAEVLGGVGVGLILFLAGVPAPDGGVLEL